MIPKPKFKPFDKDEQVLKFLGDLEKALSDIIDNFPKSVKVEGYLPGGIITSISHNIGTTHLVVSVNPSSVVWSELTKNTIKLFSPNNVNYTLILMEVK